MLHSIQKRYGEKLRAIDGEIGHVRDFYLDDKNDWSVRYVVADTGKWLAGRLVLISPHALGHLYPKGKVLLVNLTREQIEKGPSIDEHKPLSRQFEEEYHHHYGYPYYAEAWPLWGLAEYPVMAPLPLVADDAEHGGGDSHLRSTRFIKGYKVEATDGFIGHLADFLIDRRTWKIPEIVVETGHWFAGKAIHIPTDTVSKVSFDESTVYVDSTKDAIMHARKITRDTARHIGSNRSAKARSPTIMIEDRIVVIESTLVQARNIPGDRKAELLKLVAELRSEVRKLAETHQDEASSITSFAQVSAHEVSRPKKNAQLAETALQGLHLSVQGLEESHPVMVGIVNRFATALSNMGL